MTDDPVAVAALLAAPLSSAAMTLGIDAGPFDGDLDAVADGLDERAGVAGGVREVGYRGRCNVCSLPPSRGG
jgi:hypothetical protein